ncbi:MAG: DNA translocase FtsK 4TM domain-containing protein [Eubacteriales bacterium]|jgi:S-DNA-T family DNA segregation ATPase FtsK/SpoIIIE
MPQTKKKKATVKKASASSARQSPAKRAPKPLPDQRTADDLAAQIVPPILVLVALFVAVCFISAESTGFFGSWLSDVLYGLFSSAAYTIPVFIIIIAAFWKQDYEEYRIHTKFIFAGICLLCVACLSQTGGPDTFNIKQLWQAGLERHGGGVIGGLLGQALLKSIGRVGMLLVVISLLVIFALFLLGLTPHAVRICIAYKLYEQREKLRAERAAAQARKLHHNKPEVEPAVPVPVQNGGEQRRARGAYIYEEEDEGSEGDAQPADSGAEANAAADTEPAIDPAAFDAALRDSEYVPESADDAPPFDIPGMANDTVTEHIKPVGKARTAKKQAGAGAKSEQQAEPGLHEIFGESDDELDFIRKFAENRSGTMGYVSADGSRPSGGVSELGDEASEADITLSVSRGAAVPSQSQTAARAEQQAEKPKYVFPSTTLLHIEPAPKNSDVSEELHSNAVKLVETLRSFKVRTRIVNVSRGPTITRYELVPEEGVRVRSIANLVDDIALNLATTGVRIEAPIPGKSAVGIEVPNRVVSTVYARELIENPKFMQAPSKLTVTLGMDVAGEPVYLDIAKMPHLLIAGATGMGKSVCINSMIVSLLYKATPDEVKLILVDPKKVELNIYNGLPHLLVPVVSDPKKAAGSLQWAVAEMERRFDLIESVSARDIRGYNIATKDDPEKEFLPYIVIIIDELADLMMTAPSDVEESICRLAQKARAAGMHLIIGTQRPSVDVITGLIKANVPSRIAFTVSSQTDSRVVIDTNGAEKLIGRGDMLYAPVGSIKPIRVQGAYVSEKDVEAVVEFIKQNVGETDYDSEVIESIEREAERCGTSKKSAALGSDADDDFDPMLKPAIELALDSGKIATSLIQRKLKLGYGRAAKLLDRMEEMGIVSPPDGNKPREVLITRQQYMEMVVNRDVEL